MQISCAYREASWAPGAFQRQNRRARSRATASSGEPRPSATSRPYRRAPSRAAGALRPAEPMRRRSLELLNAVEKQLRLVQQFLEISAVALVHPALHALKASTAADFQRFFRLPVTSPPFSSSSITARAASFVSPCLIEQFLDRFMRFAALQASHPNAVHAGGLDGAPAQSRTTRRLTNSGISGVRTTAWPSDR